MDSKLRWPALKIARWGLQHGEFFDLYDVAYHLGMPLHEASKVMCYLRALRYVEKRLKRGVVSQSLGEWLFVASISKCWQFILSQ